jgi:hypothetical protein
MERWWKDTDRGKPRHWYLLRDNVRFYGEQLSVSRPTPSWRTTPRRLSATAYSIYSHIHSTLEAVFFIPDLRTRHSVVTGKPNYSQKNLSESYFVHHKLQTRLPSTPGLRSDRMCHGVRMETHCSDMQCIQCLDSPTPCVTVLYHGGIASHGSLDDHLTG